MGPKKSTLYARSERLAGVGLLLRTSDRRRKRTAGAKKCRCCCNSWWPHSSSPTPRQVPKEAL